MIRSLTPYSILLLATLSGCDGKLSQDITIPQPTVQAVVDKWMPLNLMDYVEEEVPLDVVMNKTEVLLSDGTDRMGLKIDMTVALASIDAGKVVNKLKDEVEKRIPIEIPTFSIPGLTPTDSSDADAGKLKLSGKTMLGQVITRTGLRFEGTDASFYCKDVVVESVQFEDFPSLDQSLLRRVVEMGLNKYFEKNAVYRLESEDAKTQLMKYSLKDVKVRDGQLVVEVGL